MERLTMPKTINWEAEAAKLRKLYQKQLEQAKDTHNLILDIPSALEEHHPEVDQKTIQVLNHLIDSILERHQ